MARKARLTEKDLKAIAYLMKGASRYEAMKKAGFSEKYSRGQSSAFFSKKMVARELKERRRQLMKKAGKTAVDIMEELWRIATVDLGDCVDDEGKLLPLKEIPAATRKALAMTGLGGGVRVSTADRLKAFEMYARLGGLWEEKFNVTTNDADLAAKLMEKRRLRGKKDEE